MKELATTLAQSDKSKVQILDEADVPLYNGEEIRLPRVCTLVKEKLEIVVDEDSEEPEEEYSPEDC